MSGFAWVTLATNDSYSLGALVLAHSLKQVGTAHQLAVLVTPGVTNVMRKNLADVFNVVEEVNLFDSKDEANLRLLKRPELGVTFTKLHCWRLTQFEKCVFLDADVLVLANSDELFERDEFSAAPDVGWPDCFNSGVFVYKPSMETYSKLVDFALQKGSFDGGDQGLLNAYFADWAHKDISKHLPFIYNMCSTACYSYLPAFKFYGANVKIVHFIGPAKPWLQYFDTESRQVQPSPDLLHLKEVLQTWWDMFCSLIHPKLSPDMAQSKQSAEHPSHVPSHSSFHENIPFSQASVEVNAHDQNLDIRNRTSDSQSNVYNVWDPWEEYEERIASIPTTNQHASYDSSAHISELASYSELGGVESGFCDNTNNISYPTPVRIDEAIGHNHSYEIAPVYENSPEQSINYSQSFSSTNTNYDYIQNVDDGPVEKSKDIEPTKIESIHHQVLINDEQHKDNNIQNLHAPVSIADNTTTPTISSNTCNIISSTSIDTLNRDLHEIHRDNIESDSTSLHNRSSDNLNPTPSVLPTQVHSLTEISLPNVCQTSANIPQDASLHAKDYDDADNKSQSGLAGAFAQFTLGEKRSPTQDALENHLRRQAWEVGNIDYMGRDSFDNIWSKICETLSTTQLQSAPDKDGAVSSSKTQQTPEVVQQVETVTVAEGQEKSESTAGIVVPEEKPKDDDKEDAPETISQKDELKLEVSTPKTEAIVSEIPKLDDKPHEPDTTVQQTISQSDEAKPEESTKTEVPIPDDKPQEMDAPAQEVKSDVPEKSEETLQKVQIPVVDDKPQEEALVAQEVSTAAVESPIVEDQQVTQPDVIPEKEPIQEKPKEETKSEVPEKMEVPSTDETVILKEETKLEESEPATIVEQSSEAGLQISEQVEIPKTGQSTEQVQLSSDETPPVAEESRPAEVKPDVILSSETKQEPKVPVEQETLLSEAQAPVSDTVIPADTLKLEESKPDVVTEAETKQKTVISLDQKEPLTDTKVEEDNSTDLPPSKTEVESKVEDIAIASVPIEETQTTKEPEQIVATEETKPYVITEPPKKQAAEAQIASSTELESEKEKPVDTQAEKAPETTQTSTITPEPAKSKAEVMRKDPKEETTQKENVTITPSQPESPKETKSASSTETKAPKIVKRVKSKTDSSAETAKVQAKSEQPAESPKLEESPKPEPTTPQESAQGEPSAEASTEAPKPKVKKVKKVKKVAKPTTEASETAEGDASKK